MVTHRALAPLFALSVTLGFSLFGITYYAPLMFQGGFGLAPNESGLLITPLAVCITIGSIVNGRIVTRLGRPNVMLYAGIACYWLAAILLSQTTAATPHWRIACVMALGGLGLGALLPNVTLLVQAAAPRVRLGIATAMVQSTRMVGSMLGTAVVGMLVSRVYEHRVAALVPAEAVAAWAGALGEPQVLVDRSLAVDFIAAAQRAGHDGAALLSGARDVLVSAVHGSQWLVAAAMLLALFWARRVPPIDIHRPPGSAGVSHE
jgi:MFS family permease